MGFTTGLVRGATAVVFVWVAGASAAIAATFEVPPGKALVYLIQSETQRYPKVPVFFDRRSLVSLGANSYVALSADPGAHVISASGAGTSSFRLTLNAGKTYFVGQRINAGGIPVFQLLSASDAQALLARYQSARSQPIATSGTVASAPATPPARQPAPAPRAAVTPETAPPAAFVLAVKSGVFKLSSTDQNWFDVPATVDDSASGVFGLELSFRSSGGWSVGGEYLRYNNTWTQTNGNRGELDTTVFTVNGKKYFNLAGTVHPYIGVGVGSGTTEFSGNITGSPTAIAYQLFGGVEFQFKGFGAFVELKSLSVDAEGDRAGGGTINVDTGGTGVFAGVSAHF
jgi:opacity protein-like surface antigen